MDDPQPIGDNWFYHMQKLNGLEAAAIYLHRDEMRNMEVPPHWNTYFTVTNMDETAMEYTLLKAAGDDVAGVMQITEEMGPVPPHWGVYFGVANVDDTTSKADFLGATILVPGTEIPGIGRFAVIQDPQGAVFGIFTGA